MSPDLLDRLHPSDYETVARLLLPDPVVGWVTSGLGEASDNEAAFARRRLLPRVLTGVADVHPSVTLLGTSVAAPIGVAPIGLMKVLHAEGEIAAAEGVADARSLLVVGVNATVDVGEIAAAVPHAHLWLQLYNWMDREALADVVTRAARAGVKAIVPLVNTPLPVLHVPPRVGFRLPPGLELAHGAASQALAPGLDWDYVSWLTSISRLPVVVKGVLHPDDARRALDAGADAVWVSNHGGRQVPRSIATLDALPAIAAAVGDRTEVYVDGGARTGTDVLIALAMGARAVFVGRPACWALAVGGARGMRRMLETLRAELLEEATMCGVGRLDDVPRELVQ